MKLPCYPLVTIDPLMSIWSPTEKLYESDTVLWCNIRKRLYGVISVDSVEYRFMGKGDEQTIEQKSLEVTPLITKYVFENEQVSLKVEFFTPLFVDDLSQLSLPCSFIKTSVASVDGRKHKIRITIKADEELCYDRKRKPTEKKVESEKGITCAVMGRKKQNPLYKTGDGVSSDWGYIYLCGDDCKAEENCISASTKSSVCNFIFAFDDVKSIEYMGKQYEGLWKEKFGNIHSAIAYCRKNADSLFEKAEKRNCELLSDAEKFGEAYQGIITAACRQILAGHKLIRNDKGELLYFSKECHSNGCINTVDVSYPAIPFFLVYRPELVKAMMTGILEFARLPVWQYDFAPHDIGQYPVANGQVYGLGLIGRIHRKKIYSKTKNYYVFLSQMPVEECGNMLIMAYTYYCFAKDKDFLEKNFDLFSKWAEYLKKVGVVLENQLCTDDFAGHSKKNVNLAIKGIMGLACFAKICDTLGKENDYMKTAKSFADELYSYKLKDGTLPFSLDNNESWSLKYNLVWDKVLNFNLFASDLYKAESELYKTKLNKYGVPLDYRKEFTKTDWMLWASVLDEGYENIDEFSKSLVAFLADCEQDVCFSDWTETKQATHHGFNHRTVQGGLWFPVLKDKLENMI